MSRIQPKLIILILGLLAVILLMTPIVVSVPPKFSVDFEAYPSLDHVCFIDSITNLQDSNDDFPYKTILNDTNIDISEVEVRLWEEKPEEYNETFYDCYLNEMYDEVNETYYNETICTPYTVPNTRNVWLERNIFQKNEDGQKGEVSHQFEEVQIKKFSTKRFKRCYYFGILTREEGWGSYGKTYIITKDEIHYDFTHSSFWNVSCADRWAILSNATVINSPIPVNDTSGIGSEGIIEWTKLNNSEAFVYNCTTYYPVANTTNELYWENETSISGNSIYEIWNDSVVLRVGFGEQSGAEALDSTQYPHNCSLSGTYTRTSNGTFGYGIELDGTTGMGNVSDHASLDLGTTGTVEVWVAAQGTTTWRSIASKIQGVPGAPQSSISYILMLDDSEHARACLSDGSTNVCIAGSIDIVDGNKHHIVFGWNSSNTSIYVDGVQDVVGVQSVNPQSSSFNLLVGYYQANYYLNGTIDELRVYNRSITPTEIQEHYWSGIDNLTSLGDKETQTVSSQINVTLNFPANDTWNTTATVNFGFTPDSALGYLNCSLWITNRTNENFSVNITNTSAVVNNTVNIIAQTLADGNYTHNIECCDNASTCNMSLANFTFKLDTTNPTSNSPADQTHFVGEPRTIGWRMQDNMESGNYTVFRDGVIQNTSTAWINYTYVNVWVDTRTLGTFNYSINFTDYVGWTGQDDVSVNITIMPEGGTGGEVPDYIPCANYTLMGDLRFGFLNLSAPPGGFTAIKTIRILNGEGTNQSYSVNFTNETIELCEFMSYNNEPVEPLSYREYIFRCMARNETVRGEILITANGCTDAYDLAISPITNVWEWFAYVWERGISNFTAVMSQRFDLFGFEIVAWQLLVIIILIVIILGAILL